MVPVKNLGELRWYGGCHYTREGEMGTLTISQKTFADELVKRFCVTRKRSVPLRVGVELETFDKDETVENWLFRELVGSLMWLSISTRPDIPNAVRAVARYCTAPRAIHWKTALGILEYINGTSEYGITFQRAEEFCLAFRWKCSWMLTTPPRQLTGGRYRVERLCVEVLVYVGFPGLRNALPFRLPKQSTLLSGTL